MSAPKSATGSGSAPLPVESARSVRDRQQIGPVWMDFNRASANGICAISRPFFCQASVTLLRRIGSGMPLGDESGTGNENCGLLTERRKGCFGLRDEFAEPQLGPRRAERADHGCLAGRDVLAGRFSDQRRISFEVEEIVGDLKG